MLGQYKDFDFHKICEEKFKIFYHNLFGTDSKKMNES